MHLIPCLSGSCVLHVPGRQVERCVANFEKFRRLRRLWQIFLSISRNSETPQPWKRSRVYQRCPPSHDPPAAPPRSARIQRFSTHTDVGPSSGYL